MDSSRFPERIEVHSTDLGFTESSKVAAILQRFRDSGQMGVLTGLTVQVNGTNNQLVDLLAGHGSVPLGEIVTLPATQFGISLANYTNALLNYVCLIYTETTTHPEAHATAGTTLPTRNEASFRIRVFTLNDILALPTIGPFAPSGTIDYSVDAQDRVLVCAAVSPNGTGQPLLAGNITNAPTDTPLLTASPLSNITGMVITALDPTTPTTQHLNDIADPNPTGLLSLATGATPPGTANLTYRAAGDTAVGAPVNVGAATPVGVFTNFTVLSSNGKSINVDVLPAMLPPTPSTTFTDVLTVSNIYEGRVPRGGGRDEAHRHLTGSGLPTLANPHGDRLKDLIDKVADFAEGATFGSGLLSSDAKALTPRVVAQQSSFGAGRTYLGSFPLNGTAVQVRLYIGNKTLEVTINALWQAGATWHKDDGAASATKFVVQSGTKSGVEVSSRTAASAADWADNAWTTTTLSMDGLASLAGDLLSNGTLKLGANLLGVSGGRDVPRVYNEYDNAGGGGAIRTALFEQRASGGVSNEKIMRVYRANSVLSIVRNDVLEITQNARWDSAGNQWVKDNVAAASAKLEFNSAFVIYLQRLAASASPFTDVQGGAGWDAPSLTFNLTLGTLSAQGGFFTSGDYNFGTPRTFRRPAGGPHGSSGSAITSSQVGLLTKSGGTTQGAVWPIIVPDGSTLVTVIVHGQFATSGGDINQLNVYRIKRDVASTIVSLSSGGVVLVADTGGVSGNGTFSCDQNNVIDNNLYTYYVSLFAPVAATFIVETPYLTFTSSNVVL